MEEKKIVLIVLIVDDEKEVRKLIMDYLNKQGFLALQAENGRLALNIVTNDIIPDLVITDLMMSVMGGLELCRSIRCHQDHRIRSLPVIILSGEEPEIHRPLVEKAGANLFLKKPVNLKELRAEIKKLLGKKETRGV